MQRKFFVLAFALAIAFPAAAFAQYGGGGGGSISPPSVTPPPGEAEVVVIINGGAKTTTNTRVTLSMPRTNANQMAISNSADFQNAAWQNYSSSLDWTLLTGLGSKTVYVKFRSSSTGKTTGISTGTITLVAVGADPQTPASEAQQSSQESSEQTNGCALTPGIAYKSANSRAVFYVTPDCTLRPFRNPNVFFTYFNTWSDVRVTTKLADVAADPLSFMPFGSKYDPKYGAIVKIVKDPKVYLLLGNKKFWITSEDVFNKLKYQWSWVEDVDESLLSKYESGGEITNTTRHPDNTLVKYAGSAKVYKLIDGKKSWITSQEVFNRLGYRFDRIVVLDDTETYQDGPDML